jgi:hypothetical protein
LPLFRFLVSFISTPHNTALPTNYSLKYIPGFSLLVSFPLWLYYEFIPFETLTGSVLLNGDISSCKNCRRCVLQVWKAYDPFSWPSTSMIIFNGFFFSTLSTVDWCTFPMRVQFYYYLHHLSSKIWSFPSDLLTILTIIF